MDRRDGVAAVVFSLIGLLWLFPQIFLGRIPFVGDLLNSFNPWFTSAAQALQSGRLPLWNPYTASGEPFLANPQAMMFYPGALVFWLFPYGFAWPAFLMMHVVLIGAGTFLLAKKWGFLTGQALFIALAMVWNGFMVVHWEFPPALAASAYVSLMILVGGAYRSRVSPMWVGFVLAITTTLLCLTGYPHFIYYILLLAVVHRLTESGRRLWRGDEPRFKTVYHVLLWGAFVGFGIVMSLPQWGPALEAVSQSIRNRIPLNSAADYSLNPAFILKFIIPDIVDKVALPFRSSPFGAEFWPLQRNWLTTFFIGTGPFVLALAALRHRSRWHLAGVALFAGMLACAMPVVFPLVWTLFPGMRYMTHFANAMLIAVWAVVFLAGFGLKDLSGDRKPALLLLALVAVVSTVVALSGTFRGMSARWLLGLGSLSEAQHMWMKTAACHSVVWMALWAGLFFFRWKGKTLSLLALLSAELWMFGHDIHPLTRHSFFHEPVTLARFVQTKDVRFVMDPELMKKSRIMTGDSLAAGYQSIRQVLYPNVHLPFRVEAAWGYEVMPNKAYADFRRQISGNLLENRLVRFLSGGIVLSETDQGRFKRADHYHFSVHDNPDVLPKATWNSRRKVIPGSDERLRYLVREWDPSSETVLETGTEGGALTGVQGGPLSFGETEESVSVRGERSTAGFLVMNRIYYPGWEVFVNGKRGTLLRANHAFQCVETPAGYWDVVFKYRPRIFYLAVWGFVSVSLFLIASNLLMAIPKKRAFFASKNAKYRV
ncbi:MAG TPA: hypothetical protein PK876_03090 [Elusimicrobiota bacterium]|nr:hypothetical protein [Elusimicrobiota bacterium]